MTACTTVRPVQPAEYIPKYYPDVVWVTYADSNSEVLIDGPAIYGDTLRGTRQGGADSVAIPLGEVRSVRARTPDHTKTALLVGATVAGSVASIYFLWASKAGSNTAGVSCGVDPDGRPYMSC
ncbi:MAG TPA: hypothetical protein VLV16_13835 [Gemmatimonadales bacterium]|nr:hypothetical protein [Gemmatimonadales bacterium]